MDEKKSEKEIRLVHQYGSMVPRGEYDKTIPLWKFREVYETIDGALELTDARKNNPELRGHDFITSNTSVFTIEDGEAILYFGDKTSSSVFRNKNPVFSEISGFYSKPRELGDDSPYPGLKRNYDVNDLEMELVRKSVASGKTARIKISELELTPLDSSFYDNLGTSGYFTIQTDNLDDLNDTQRALAERYYGLGDDFETNMKAYADDRLGYIFIESLSEEHIKNTLKEGEAIARVSILGRTEKRANTQFSCSEENSRTVTDLWHVGPYLSLYGRLKNKPSRGFMITIPASLL